MSNPLVLLGIEYVTDKQANSCRLTHEQVGFAQHFTPRLELLRVRLPNLLLLYLVHVLRRERIVLLSLSTQRTLLVFVFLLLVGHIKARDAEVVTAGQADRLDHDLVADGAVLVLIEVTIAIARFFGEEVLVLEEFTLLLSLIVTLLLLELLQFILQHLLDAGLEVPVPHVYLNIVSLVSVLRAVVVNGSFKDVFDLKIRRQNIDKI